MDGTVRSRSENLGSIYVLLFLTVAFFFLEYEDATRYAALFSFDWTAVQAGQAWRVLTYQFTQAGQGWLWLPQPLMLFFSLLILYIMGTAIEEEWGTRAFLTLFVLSSLVSAAVAAWLGVAILGSYFVNFSLFFVYASVFPDQTFYFFGVIPIRVRWLAIVAAVLLLAGVMLGGPSYVAAFSGALASYAYFLARTVRINIPAPQPATEEEDNTEVDQAIAIRNAARFVAIRKAITAGSTQEIDRLIIQCEREITPAVNICPPPDYKPEHSDGYCIRCEGYAECSARYLRMNRKTVVDAEQSS